MLFRISFLAVLAVVQCHAGPLVPSCNRPHLEGNLPLEGGLPLPLTGSRSTWNEEALPLTAGVKGLPKAIVQEPIVQTPIVQAPIVQTPVIQEPLVQEPLPIRETQVVEQLPVVQEQLPVVQEVLPVREQVVEQVPVVQEVLPQIQEKEIVQEVKSLPTPAPIPVRVWTEAPVQQTFVQETVEPIVETQQFEQSEVGVASHLRSTFLPVSAPMSLAAQRLNLPHGVDHIVGGIDTSFTCWGRSYGYFADIANGCKVFHICHNVINNGVQEMAKSSFFCPAGTIFDQIKHICIAELDALPCSEAIRYYPHTEQRFAPPTNFFRTTFSSPMMAASTISKTRVMPTTGVKGGMTRVATFGEKTVTQEVVTELPPRKLPVQVTQEIRSEIVPEFNPLPKGGVVRTEFQPAPKGGLPTFTRSTGKIPTAPLVQTRATATTFNNNLPLSPGQKVLQMV